MACDHFGFANLTARRVRHTARAGLLFHSAGCVGNLPSNALADHAARCIGNSASDAFFVIAARRVRNFAGAGLADHRASCVRNLLLAGFCHKGARCVRHSLYRLNRNLTANRVRNLFVADFRDHASAGNGLLDHLRTPFAAADGSSRTLHTNLLAAAGIAWITDTLFNNRPRNVVSFRHPFSATNIDSLAFSNRLADRVAHVFVAGLRFCSAGGAAHIFVAGLVDRLADVVANRAIAGLIHRLAGSAANVSIAGLIHGLANAASNVAVTRLIDGLTDIASYCAIARLIDRLADRVTFVTVAGRIHVPLARDRIGFRALIVHRLHARVLLCFPHDVLNRVTLRIASTASCDEVTTR